MSDKKSYGSIKQEYCFLVRAVIPDEDKEQVFMVFSNVPCSTRAGEHVKAVIRKSFAEGKLTDVELYTGNINRKMFDVGVFVTPSIKNATKAHVVEVSHVEQTESGGEKSRRSKVLVLSNFTCTEELETYVKKFVVPVEFALPGSEQKQVFDDVEMGGKKPQVMPTQGNVTEVKMSRVMVIE